MKLLSVLSLCFIIGSCVAQTAKELDADAFEKGIGSAKVQVLDVRTDAEYKSGHIKNALLADWTNPQQFADRTQYLDKSKPVYIYCLSGGRSAAAAKALRKQGYEVLELKGGINSWKASGKAVENNANSKQMSSEEYATLINSAPIVLVDFGAEWCPPCKQMEPILQALTSEKKKDFKLVKVDGGNDLDVMKQNGVDALPVFIIYKDGKQVWKKQGVVSKVELEKNL